MLLYEPDSDLFAIPHAATGLADKVVIMASHMAPSLPAEDANPAIIVGAAYFTSVFINRIPQLHTAEDILKSTIGDNPNKGKTVAQCKSYLVWPFYDSVSF